MSSCAHAVDLSFGGNRILNQILCRAAYVTTRTAVGVRACFSFRTMIVPWLNRADRSPGLTLVVATAKRIPESQPNTKKIKGQKLKVDNLMERAHISIIDICLLSFGYCAFDSAP